MGRYRGKEQEGGRKYVSVADPVTFDLYARELNNNIICSPGLDDKVGLVIAMEALRLCARSKLSVALYAVSTVQEELGLRGATTSSYGINPEVGIAIDVTHASDSPATTEKKTSPCELAKAQVFTVGQILTQWFIVCWLIQRKSRKSLIKCFQVLAYLEMMPDPFKRQGLELLRHQ